MTNTNTTSAKLARVAFDGADAAAFLQGQLSADVAALEVGKWARAAYCSRQGRVLASMVLCRAGDDNYVAAVRDDIADDLITRLSRFVLRAKVSMRRDDGNVVFAKGEGFAIDDDLIIRAEDNNGEDDDWQRAEILRGIAWIGKDTQEMFLPQFINLDLLGGVNFKKGCYVGQEVIARLHYLGAVKRRAMIIRGKGDKPPEGAKLLDAKGATMGEVINAVNDNDNNNGETFTALAALILAKMEGGVFYNDNNLSITPPNYLPAD